MWTYTEIIAIFFILQLIVKQELPTFSWHLSSSSVLSVVCVTRTLVLWICFVDRCLGTPVSSTVKTDRQDIAEILLKVALNTIHSVWRLPMVTEGTQLIGVYMQYTCYVLFSGEQIVETLTKTIINCQL
jgi:hypothetical protein